MSPFTIGYQAQREGRPRDKCPYMLNNLMAHDWRRGWDTAEKFK